MKRFLPMILLALALPFGALADSNNQVDFGNSNGTLKGTNAGLTLTGSTLVLVNGYDGLGKITGNDLGTINFSTGALISGTVYSGGVFAGGGSFQISTNGTQGLPNGVIFTGSFSGPVDWTLHNLGNGNYDYTLSGPVSGTLIENGQNISVVGFTIQLTVSATKGHGPDWNSITIASGNTTFTPVPEPGTLGLLGTGLLGVAALVRHKWKTGKTGLRST